jgi:hypothetical protein
MAYNMGRLKRAGFCKIYMDLPSPRTSGYNQNWLPWALSLAAVALMTAALCFEGRIWWCQHGDSAIYINDAWSTHTSQHFLDPYSFTHILHGVMFFWIAALVFSKRSATWRFLIAVIAEAGWEILENSNFIIEKYRENTASLDKLGESLAN